MIRVIKIMILVMFLFTFGCCRSRLKAPCQQPPRIVVKPLPKPVKSVLTLRGGQHLDNLHPALVKRARLLYERAQALGIEIRFISGYRKYRAKKPKKPGGSLASWHNFGAAFDLNLTHRKSMREALKNLNHDENQWNQLGKIAKELGLTWGRPWGDAEIFHFEWHPGHPEALRAPAFQRLIKVTGPKVKNYRRSWTLFDVVEIEDKS